MSEQTAYPLAWPAAVPRTPSHQRRGAAFSDGSRGRLSIYAAVSRLMREISAFTRSGQMYRIHPKRVVISTNMPVKADGTPYSNRTEPKDCGVAVYFTFDSKPYCMPCDKWDRIADNIAAVAAHLNAMRGQERWGVGSMEQAFTGYLALNEKTQASCWEVLDVLPDSTEERVMSAYRAKAKTAHPNAGGSAEAWNELNAAKDIALATIRNRNAR